MLRTRTLLNGISEGERWSRKRDAYRVRLQEG
jgi:hypothetical protein